MNQWTRRAEAADVEPSNVQQTIDYAKAHEIQLVPPDFKLGVTKEATPLSN